MNPFNPDSVQPILDRANQKQNAELFNANTQHPFRIQSMTLKLDTAQLPTSPLKIGFPFKALWVQTATDTVCSLNIKIGTSDSFQSPLPLHLNDAFAMAVITSEAYIDWAAQAGKSITLIFFIDAEFRPGVLNNSIVGQVTPGFGSTATLSQVTLVGATAAAVAAALATRKQATIQNQTGASIFVGGANTVTAAGATQGIEVLNKGVFTWQNTAQLFAISTAGGVVNILEEA